MATLLDGLAALLRRDALPVVAPAPLAAPAAPPDATRTDGALERRADNWAPPWVYAAAADCGTPSIFAQTPLPDEFLWLLWQFSGIAGRYVDLPAERATRKGWSCSEVDEAENKRLKIYSVVQEGIKWSRLWGDAVGVMFTEDDIPRSLRRSVGGDPRMWMREPLDLSRVRRVSHVTVFDGQQAQVMSYQRDPSLPGFGEPLMWSISAGTWYGQVHHSRVMWFRGRRRPPSKAEDGWNGRPDDSVLQAGYRALDLLIRTMDAGGELAKAFHETIVKLEQLAAIATGDQAAELQARLAFMRQAQREAGIVLLGKGDEYQTRTHSPAGFEALTTPEMRYLAAEFGWPQTTLYGDGPGGLSTDERGGRAQERQLWSDTQESHRAALEYLYLVLLSSRECPPGGKVPEEWALTVNALDEPDAKTTAEVRKLEAETAKIYVETKIWRPNEVTEKRFGEEGYVSDIVGMTPIDPEVEARAAAERAEQARQAMAARAGGDPSEGGGDPVPPGADTDADTDPQPPERADAAGDGVCIWVPSPDPGPELRAAVERAIGQRLVVSDGSDTPHTTVLYLGGPLSIRATAEVVRVVKEEARVEVAPLRALRMHAFPPDSNGRVPIVVLLEGWGLGELHSQLLRRHAHRVKAKQHPSYKPHLTLGYAERALTPEQTAALLEVDVSAVRVPVTALEVVAEDKVVLTVGVGS